MRKRKAQKLRTVVDGTGKRMYYECFHSWKGIHLETPEVLSGENMDGSYTKVNMDGGGD